MLYKTVTDFVENNYLVSKVGSSGASLTDGVDVVGDAISVEVNMEGQALQRQPAHGAATVKVDGLNALLQVCHHDVGRGRGVGPAQLGVRSRRFGQLQGRRGRGG